MYRGRFAPSPTGPLHLGSLLAATASWLDARANNGFWMVRIEDTDPPREDPLAAQQILRSLEKHGLYWDEMIHQSGRLGIYRNKLEQLRESGLIYPCTCSRAEIQAMGGNYDGRCRTRTQIPEQGFAWRFRADQFIKWFDLFTGSQHESTPQDLADFVVWRRDDLVAYQLAVAVDDAEMGMTHVIRGFDLLDSTAPQLAIIHALKMQAPQYGHVPLVLGADGNKLSKQNKASALQDEQAGSSLVQVLKLLNHAPPAEVAGKNPQDILQWAVSQWDRSRIKQILRPTL